MPPRRTRVLTTEGRVVVVLAATAVFVLLVLVLHVKLARAHPGRLAADGCHAVHQDYRDHGTGEVLYAKNSRHCHGRLDHPSAGVRLDGAHSLGEAPRLELPHLPITAAEAATWSDHDLAELLWARRLSAKQMNEILHATRCQYTTVPNEDIGSVVRLWRTCLRGGERQ